MASAHTAIGESLRKTLSKEKPKNLWLDLVAGVQGMVDRFSPAPVQGRPGSNEFSQGVLQNTGRFAGEVLKQGAQGAAYPFTATAGLLKDLGKDVVSGVTGAAGMQPPEWSQGGYWDKTGIKVERYGPITATGMNAVEGLTKGGAAATAGAMSGQAYGAWKAAGQPLPGAGYVEPIQRQRVRDPKTPVKDLIKDHEDYHRQLGTKGEGKLSQYHEELSQRIAAEKGLPKPVLDEDYENLFLKENQALKDLPHAKGPFREVKNKPDILEQTEAEKTALYRYEYKRTYTASDQWDDFKSGVVQDLRRAGASDEAIQAVKELPMSSKGKFGRVLKMEGMPDNADKIFEAWKGEIEEATSIFSKLKSGKPMGRAAAAPVTDMRKSVFASSRPGSVNAGVADAFREAGKLYAQQGDVARAGAYNKIADLMTSRGAPNLADLAEKGPEAILNAFKGKGLGERSADRIVQFLSEGTFDELEALRLRFPKAQGR